MDLYSPIVAVILESKFSGTAREIALESVRRLAIVDGYLKSPYSSWGSSVGKVYGEETQNHSQTTVTGEYLSSRDVPSTAETSFTTEGATLFRHALEQAFTRTFEYAKDSEIQIWSMATMDLNTVATEFGEITRQPYTPKQIAQDFYSRGQRISQRAVNSIIKAYDDRLRRFLREQELVADPFPRKVVEVD